MQVSINELLVLQKAIRGRMGQLQALQTSCAKKETFFGRDENKVVEPQYDVKSVDKKIVELQNFIYKADALVKQSNAVTRVEIECNIDELLAPLK